MPYADPIKRRKYYHEWYLKNKDHVSRKLREWRKENSERYKKTTREYWSGYKEKNKEKIRIKNKAWYEENKEHRAATNKLWYQKNRGRVANTRKRWRANNPNRYRELWLKFRKDNKAKCSVYYRRRRKTIRLAIPKWADFDLMNDMYAEAEHFNLQVDHIVPLLGKNVCGLHCEGNLQLLTREENMKKGNSHAP